MKCTILFFIFFYSTYSIAQSYPKGTILAATITEDGILFGADSKGCFYKDSAGQKILYASMSNMQKLFTIGKFNFKIAISGASEVMYHYWKNVIDRYNKNAPDLNDIPETYSHFISFVRKYYKATDSALKQNLFVMAGYDRNGAILLSADSSKIDTVRVIYGLTMSGDCFGNGYVGTTIPYTCEYMVGVFTVAMDYCSATNKGIGKPYYLIQIKPDNTVKELSKVNFYSPKNSKQTLKDILKERIEISYWYDYSKDLLRKNTLKMLKEHSYGN